MELRQALVWLGLVGKVVGELFSSMADLETLLDTESRAVDALHRYIEAEEERLQQLRKWNGGFVRLASEPVVETLGGVSNPISAFTFIRGWMKSPLMQKFRQNNADDVLESIEGMPGKEDLEGAVKGLVRLQLTYAIPTKDLAYGYAVPGLDNNGTVFSISDCFEIGKIMYSNEYYFYALEWLEEAWQKTERSDHIDESGKVDILDYLSWAYFQTGNVARAYWTAKRSMGIQDFNPDEHTRDNFDYFIKDLQESGSAVPQKMSDLPPITNIPPYKRDEMKLYDDLCVEQPTPPTAGKFTCRYLMPTPFLRLCPVKEEILSRDPPVSLFHNFIRDGEIEHLVELATPKLRRALVVDRSAGFTEKPAEYRVAKNAWMRETDDDVLDAVNARIGDATGLSQESAEFLQMANYGIAGQYEPHFDMSTEEEDEDHDPYDDNLGNRIATVLIYLNNPVSGGGTVFGDLNLHVQPNKGSAVFWYNLHLNGTADTRMRHAACPVLVGQKWVANKWIRAKGQELRRLCDTNRYV